jgi:lysozyme
MRHINEQGLDLIKRFEGFYAKPYICPAGYWTIGYGHLCDKNHSPISKEQAEEYLKKDLAIAENGILAYSPTAMADLTDNQFSALVSFAFNLGIGAYRSSTLRKKINAKEFDEVPNQLRRWVFANGRKLTGLALRRNAEAALFMS